MPRYALDGRQPTLADDVWIAPTADVIGDARLGPAVSVWFGAVIRADNTPIVIDARSNVQDSALLHSDPNSPLTIGKGVTIGHYAICHGCTIGDNVLVGMGATILNGAVIGDSCLIGAGALVAEGKVFPAGSLIIGSPARVSRALAPEEVSALRMSAEVYVAKARVYALTLVRID